eukprot:TRINITY_DN7150_c0_g1_i3.p1 TRINITY_DN7150_c0_g1~~TRINITY_DN7150_c0_g1_i3.p1  ORF type:complete len:657 (+),score=186.57 TRINITY_DN7150_c0_g1_i3:1045-3015(+)
MGCIWSTLDKEEIMQRCKERKRLMKQLVGFRGEFAITQMAYLQALRNTGITLRQFTEGDSLDLESTQFGPTLPPSPPPPLPPSPPPPPPFSPDERRVSGDDQKDKRDQEEYTEIDEDDSRTPPPPPVHDSTWDFWDQFAPSSSPFNRKKSREDVRQAEEDEDWAETKTEFEEDQEDDGETAAAAKPLPKKSPPRELMDDNSSMVSWYTKDTADMAMVVWRSKKTVVGIVKELDDYFLKASEGVKEIGVLLEANRGKHLPQHLADTKKKSCKSAKVFSALSWSWSSKSLLSNRDSFEVDVASEASKLGGLSRTLEKLYAEERRLYEEIKEEETAKFQLEKKTVLLHKQETGDQDWMKAENTRSSIETLQSEILCIQEAISSTCLSMLKLRDEELYPQLLELSSGLMQMWRTMYECHQVQNHIAQQMNHLSNHPSTEPTTDYHRQATVQFEAEVTSWYNTFCNLLTSQREFVRALNQWVRLTDFLPNNSPTNSTSEICALCEEWQLAVERLPDKAASEAIKSFISVIHSIVLQHDEERKLQKRSSRLEKRLEKERNLLNKLEKKSHETLNASGPSPDDSFLVEREKIDTLKKKVEEEKGKYLNSVNISHAMMLNNLQMGLPNVFQAMTRFSSVCAQAFEAVHGHAKGTSRQDDSTTAV